MTDNVAGHGSGSTATMTQGGPWKYANAFKTLVGQGGNVSPETRKAYYSMASAIVQTEKSANPNFNTEEFYRACGISPEWQQAAA